MKMDGRHVAAALTLLAGSAVYNVWASATPQAGISAAGASAGEPALAGSGSSAVAAPPQSGRSPALPDLRLDEPPEWTRDPFAGPRLHAAPPEAPPQPAALEEPEIEPELTVNAVLYSPSRKLAIVNGRTVRPGDRIGNVTVADILPSGVVIRSAGGTVRTIDRRSPAARERR